MIAFPLLPKTCYNFSNWVGSSAQIMTGKVRIHVKPYAALINLTATLSRSLASITEPRKNSTLVKCLLNRPSRSRFGNRLQVIEIRDNYTPNSGCRKGNGFLVKCQENGEENMQCIPKISIDWPQAERYQGPQENNFWCGYRQFSPRGYCVPQLFNEKNTILYKQCNSFSC